MIRPEAGNRGHYPSRPQALEHLTQPGEQPLRGWYRRRRRGAQSLLRQDLAANHVAHTLPVLEARIAVTG